MLLVQDLLDGWQLYRRRLEYCLLLQGTWLRESRVQLVVLLSIRYRSRIAARRSARPDRRHISDSELI